MNSMKTLNATSVLADNHAQMATFVLNAKRGNPSAAADFIRGVLSILEPNPLVDRPPAPPLTVQTSLGNGIPSHPPTIRHSRSPGGSRVYNPAHHINRLSDASSRRSRVTRYGYSATLLIWKVSSLVLMIPSHIVGHVIGKGGSEVSSIETKTGARIKILPARTKDALERSVRPWFYRLKP